jgi:hypothetical protein
MAEAIAGLYGLELYPHSRTTLEVLGTAAAAGHALYELDARAVLVLTLEA